VHSQKKRVNRPGVAPKDAKTCFVFLFLANTMGTFGHLPALILTIFETNDMVWCAHA